MPRRVSLAAYRIAEDFFHGAGKLAPDPVVDGKHDLPNSGFLVNVGDDGYVLAISLREKIRLQLPDGIEVLEVALGTPLRDLGAPPCDPLAEQIRIQDRENERYDDGVGALLDTRQESGQDMNAFHDQRDVLTQGALYHRIAGNTHELGLLVEAQVEQRLGILIGLGSRRQDFPRLER